ncbi:phosphatase PAP2 family protein [Microbacterium sp. SLBN-146]|uniref:phosphatase PAP2 family protein n=1 Tax=Microbacterium sp. SLBN-146 TaxID=2768457 RepID=UPI00114DE445|nr:phosphatase PAP2 family protein [Microbacterium sp. SLBN-146]TQJ31226.1 undecaprenyl-diphosphatase [Microbacterium sp. SLBN-146]
MRANGATTDTARLRAVPLIVWGLVLVVLATGLGAWVYLRGSGPFVVDAWWEGVMSQASAPFLSGLSLAMNFLGGGWFAVFVVPIGGTIVFLILRRPWTATYFLVAQAVSAGLVQVLKSTFGRARPEGILIVSDFGSFPSGHAAGAATLATIFVVLFPRTVVVLIGAAWVLLMSFSRTYLLAHWLSDTLGGVLVGVGAALVLAGAMSRPLGRELESLRATR